MNPDQLEIVFYDGECGLCDRSVQLILNNERDATIYFAALQSEFAKDFFQRKGLKSPSMDSIVFYNGSNFLIQADAVAAIAAHLRFPFKIIRYMSWIPLFIRNGCYNLVAKNRKRLVANSCTLPQPSQMHRFLDQL